MGTVTTISRGEPRLYVLWRIEGDFTLSDLPGDLAGTSPDILIGYCIKAEQEFTKGMTDDEVLNDIARATLVGDPHYRGYEMPIIMLSTDAVFFQT